MTLVKSLYSGDPEVIPNTRSCKWFRFTALARAIRPTSQFKSMCKATCRGPNAAPALGQVEVPNSQLISCLDSSLGRASACGAGGGDPRPTLDMFV